MAEIHLNQGVPKGIRLGITPGEPAGIGPDICLQSFALADEGQKDLVEASTELVYFADPDLLRERAARLNLNITINDLNQSAYRSGEMNVSPVALCEPVKIGTPDSRNAHYVLGTLEAALNQCVTGEISAIVTGPVHKANINEAGIPFSGHTEWFAEKTATHRVVMMLLSGSLRVALATTHLPLSAVPSAITAELLTETLMILATDLRDKFGIEQPRITVCGLNPHAGEGGYLGREEIEVIAPVIDQLKEKGLKLTGPLPADTAFTDRVLADTDAVLAMYHDQGLPVLKHVAFGDAVNVTLGLPIIRTSVDHGTAFDLAGTGKADPGSLAHAIRCATELASHH